MKKGSSRFSIEGKPLYPHVKLTRERFPRALVTRIIEDDDAEYFGAFLNRTNARILIDFLNRIFRLRSCDIEVDGSFNYPCTMHYKGRCIAPCVGDLCDDRQYGEMVSIVRLFLMNDRHLFRTVLTTKIEASSETLDFESAAKWRDILTAVEGYWDDTRHSVWLDGTSDTFQARETESGLDVFLISQKGRRVLGERAFWFADAGLDDQPHAIAEVISQFYRFHAPKEIRVPCELPQKRDIEAELKRRVGRKVPIVRLSEKNRKVSTEMAVNRSSAELDLARARVNDSASQLLQGLKRSLALPRKPAKIIAVDVSHISGTDQVAAAITWANGRIDPAGARSWVTPSTHEIASMEAFVRMLVRETVGDENTLLLIDGGPSQLKAAMSVELATNISIAAAVKPADDHESISHFLTADGRRFEFDMASPAHRLLHRLRDEAHDFANAVHRDTRDYSNYYRMAEMLPSITESDRRELMIFAGSVAAVERLSDDDLRKRLGAKNGSLAAVDLSRYRSGESLGIHPLVVPTRLQAEKGAADDLRPIDTVVPKGRPRSG